MANHNMDITKIKQFWAWFNQNCNSFGTDFDNTELLTKLDEWINALGDYSWEIGPGKMKENALVISPNGDLELLEETKEIIKNAIDCPGWEYYYAKPPKEWNMVFDFETSDDKQVEIDASKWEYYLLKYDDGMFEIVIKAPNLVGFDDMDQLIAAEITLDGVIGEELRIQTICEIEVVTAFEKAYKEKTASIKNLPDHLKSLAKI